MRAIPLILVFLLAASAGWPADTIIRRHDVPDSAYVDYAQTLSARFSIVRHSRTDVAGTLINPTWILSAAHVANWIEPGNMLLGHDGDSLQVKRVTLHPDWLRDGSPHDIALIELADSVLLSEYPTLYSASDEQGRIVVMIGNGDIGTGLTGPEGNDGRFRAATNRIDEVTPTWIRWRFDNADVDEVTDLEGISGPGDSSSPAFFELEDGTFTIAGVSAGQSTRETNGQNGRYGVVEFYTRTSAYVDWIEATVAN